MLVDWHFVCSGWQVLSAAVIVITVSYKHLDINCSFEKDLFLLTTVLFIRGAVVIAVVDAVANIVFCNATAIVAGELSTGITRPEQTALLIAVVSAVIIMVTAVVIGHATAISTSEDCRLTSVEGWELNGHILEHMRDR